MLLQLGEPGVGDEDAFFLGVVVSHGVPLLVRLGDHILHVLIAERADNTKEEVALWETVAQLLLGGQVKPQNP